MTRLLFALFLSGCATAPTTTPTVEYFGRCTEKVKSGTPDIRDMDYRRSTPAAAAADIAAFRQNFPGYACVIMEAPRTE